MAEVVVDISRREAVLGQHGSACCARHELARSAYVHAPPFGPPKGHQVLVYSTLTAMLLATFSYFRVSCAAATLFAFQTYTSSRVAEVGVDLSRREAVRGQHGSACYARQQLATLFAFQTYNWLRVAELVVDICRGEAVLGQHGSA